ncbi:glycosyltransferase, partial [bacterium]|nr:glycosyltransferase [bacterium]
DDGSTDKTRQLIISYGSRIKYFYQENTGLPAKARNRGIREATGEYIAFLDSDDKWAKDKLAKQIEIFERFPQVDLTFTGIKIIDKEGNVLRRKKGEFIKENVLLSLVEKGNFIANSSVMVRRKALLKVGMLDEDERIRGSEDFLLWIKLAVNHKFYSIGKELTLYRKNADSICTPLSIKTAYDKIFLKKEIYCRIRKIRGRCLSRLHYELSRYYFSHQDFSKARKEFFKAFLNYPGCLLWYLFFIMSLLCSGWLKAKIKLWAAG